MELNRIAIAPPRASSIETVSAGSKATESKSSFADELGRAIDSVEQLQLKADNEAEAVAKGGGNLHEAALALEKADVAMRLATKVRNKFVDAYQEIMRMNV